MKFLEYLEGYQKRLEDINRYDAAIKNLPDMSFHKVVLSVASHSDYLESEFIYLRNEFIKLSKEFEALKKSVSKKVK